MSDPIRVILVDDDHAMQQGIAALIRLTPDMELIGQAHNGDEAIVLCGQHTPDIVLMDVMMPGLSGMETTKILCQNHPDLKVLVLSSYAEYGHIKDMLDSGAIGYLVKTAIADDLIDTIRNTLSGNTVFSPEVVQTILDRPTDATPNDFGLTERELQVLELIAKGQTNSQIAYQLGISQPTVRFHFNNILLKFAVETRSEVLVLAAKNGLV